MSARSQKILELALKGNQYDQEENEESSIYSTSGSDTTYIPSSDDQSDDGTGKSDTATPPSPEVFRQQPITVSIEDENQIAENKAMLGNDNANNKKENIALLYFEYEHNFNANNVITDNDIYKLNVCIPQCHAAISTNVMNSSCSKTKKDNQAPNLFNSPFLINNKYKKTMCKFCDSEIVSKHFARHVERNHGQEKEIKEIFSFEAKSVERKRLLSLLRNEGNLELAIRGHIIPKKREKVQEIQEADYAICKHCKGYYKRLCLSRHMKKCFAKKSESDTTKHERPLAESLIYSASHKTYGQILNKLAVKKEIFSKMQADNITSTAINDILLILFGEDLLKKTKNKRSIYHLSNKLRECGKFLLEMRKFRSYSDMLSTLKPENFDDVIEATKNMSRYDIETRSFGAASLALHFGTTLKKLSELAVKLILRKKIPLPVSNVENTLTDLERFKKIVESQWTTEVGSLALKDLNEKAAIKPKLLPVTEDIIKLKQFLEKNADEAYEKLKTSKSRNSYRTLVEATLVLTILHNRKRVGDIQYLDLNSYSEQIHRTTNTTVQTEMVKSLSKNEIILTQHYKRIVSIGKGSRAVTILIPKNIQKYYTMIHTLRTNETWFPNNNTYFFTYPKSIRWIDGCTVIRKYAKQCGAKHPELLTSCRLRKHIATVTQVLSLKNNEIDQLAKFMGHTSKTHETFYKLPQDIYQVAKVSKILQLMEKGNVNQFKNKCLEEIDIDMENIEEDADPLENDLEAPLIDHEATAVDNLIENNRAVNSVNIIENITHNTTANITDEVTDIIIDNASDNVTYNAISDDNSESDINSPTTSKNRLGKTSREKTSSRQRWTDKQKKLMSEYFRENVKNKKALRKKECEIFLEIHKKMFVGVGWVRVKTFIFNEYRLID